MGFIFSQASNVEALIASLIRKANTRTFVLRHYSTFMNGKDFLKLNSALVRSILEYTLVTYGPMLSKSQSNHLERVQKNCLKIMFRYRKLYEELLSESGLATLKHRRGVGQGLLKSSLCRSKGKGKVPPGCLSAEPVT